MQAAIDAISYFLPADVLGNADLSEQHPEWSVDKIADKTGIARRHIASAQTCSSDLAVESARKLFAEHQVDPAQIDFVLLCTQSPDYFLPTTACLLQERLGLSDKVGALDFNLGCSGYVYGLSLARGLVQSGDAKRVLLITAETYSKFIHPHDKSARTIFGDAAAATIVSGSERSDELAPTIGPFVFGTDGRGAKNLIVATGGMRDRRTGIAADVTDDDGNVHNPDALYMNGAEIFTFTLKRIPPLVEAVLAKAGLRDDDIDLYVFHQANRFMLDALRKRMKIPEHKFYVYMAECGNTVSSTIPIALSHAMSEGRIRPGSRVALIGFGVGYSWAGCIARF